MEAASHENIPKFINIHGINLSLARIIVVIIGRSSINVDAITDIQSFL
jgi:hypothetical protein